MTLISAVFPAASAVPAPLAGWTAPMAPMAPGRQVTEDTHRMAGAASSVARTLHRTLRSLAARN